MAESQVWNWTFRGYVDSRGYNVAQVWYDSELGAVRAEFDTLLNSIRQRSHIEWPRMRASTNLVGNGQGLTELKFHVNKVQYRPIGFFGPAKQTFTILIVATKPDFDAKCTVAQKRKVTVISNPGVNSNECDCLSDITREA